MAGVFRPVSSRRSRGPNQTVPRSELQAFALFLEATVGPMQYVTDHMPLRVGWRRGRPWRLGGETATLGCASAAHQMLVAVLRSRS
eukprot:3313648-Pyramimonas_sp.AAC.1